MTFEPRYFWSRVESIVAFSGAWNLTGIIPRLPSHSCSCLDCWTQLWLSPMELELLPVHSCFVMTKLSTKLSTHDLPRVWVATMPAGGLNRGLEVLSPII